jgi:hypothetical protein
VVYSPNPVDPERPISIDHHLGNHHGWHIVFETKSDDGCYYMTAAEVDCDFPTQAMADAFHLKLFDGSFGPVVNLRREVLWFNAAGVAEGEWVPPEGESAWDGYRFYLPAPAGVRP